MEFYDLLKSACDDIGVEFDEKKYNQFIKYKELIQEWNQKVNLTAITEDEEIIKKHFIDSIKLLKFNKIDGNSKIIDIGTGGGFPGIPLKIVMPNIKITLLDSLRKRVSFLELVTKELGLTDVEPIHGRAEDFAQQEKYREKYDFAVSRAVANMTVLSELCIPFVKVNGYFLPLKGPAIDDEMRDASNAIAILGCKVEKIIDVVVEDSDLKHNLVIVKKFKNTPKKYPRKAGMVTKNPLK